MQSQRMRLRPPGVNCGRKPDIFARARRAYRTQGAHPVERKEMLRLLKGTNLASRRRILSEIVLLQVFILHCSPSELARLCDLCKVDVLANSFELFLGCAMRSRHAWQRFSGTNRKPEPGKLSAAVAKFVDFLLERGGDINATNEAGLTVLQKASDERCGLSTLHLLISRGAKGLREGVALDPIKSAALRKDTVELERLLAKPGVQPEQFVDAMELLWAVRLGEREEMPSNGHDCMLQALNRRQSRKIPHRQWVTSCPFLVDARVMSCSKDMSEFWLSAVVNQHVLSAILILEKAFGSMDAIDIEVGFAIMRMVTTQCGSRALAARILRELCIRPNFPLMLCAPVRNSGQRFDLTFREFALTCAAFCRAEVPRAWRCDLVNYVRFLLNGQLWRERSAEAHVATLRSDEERTAALYAITFTIGDVRRPWDQPKGEPWLLALMKDGANVGARGWSGYGASWNSPLSFVLSWSVFSDTVRKAFLDSFGCCDRERRPGRLLVTRVDPLRCLAAKLLYQYPVELTQELDHAVLRGDIILKDFVDLHRMPYDTKPSKRARLSETEHSNHRD